MSGPHMYVCESPIDCQPLVVLAPACPRSPARLHATQHFHTNVLCTHMNKFSKNPHGFKAVEIVTTLEKI